jgi:hypothetical protein
MSRYPILIEQFKGEESMTIVCEQCLAEAVLGPDDLYSDGWYTCPAGCPGVAVYKYDEGDKCPACAKLGFWDRRALGGCCSRRCQLQVEYAEQLRRSRPSPAPSDQRPTLGI